MRFTRSGIGIDPSGPSDLDKLELLPWCIRIDRFSATTALSARLGQTQLALHPIDSWDTRVTGLCIIARDKLAGKLNTIWPAEEFEEHRI